MTSESLRDRLTEVAELLPDGVLIVLPRDRLKEALHAESVPTPPKASLEPEADEMLTAKQAAALLGVKVRWLYEHPEEVPQHRIGPRTIRYPKRKLLRWMERRKSQ